MRDISQIERKLREYEAEILNLKKIERELNSLNTEGFESEAQSIKSKLKDLSRVAEVEKEFSELKQKIIRKEQGRIRTDRKYREAKEQIKYAESAIEKAKEFGCHAFEAEELLEKAERAIYVDDYEKAISDAKEAKEFAKEIKKKSTPEISVELSKEKFQQGVWVDVLLKISNDGNAHAKDVEIGFSEEVKVKGLEIIERLDVEEETELEVSFKPVDVGEKVPLEISTRFEDLDGKRYGERETVNISVGGIKREVVKERIKELEIPTEKKERALIIERAIYDPCKGDFIEGRLPRMNEWVNSHDPSAYWFAISLQNNADRAIEEWGVELETSAALKIKEAKIEGIEYEIPQEVHLEVFKISVPKEYGIVIPKGGTQRVYFKLRAEKPKTTYEISGIFKSAISGDVPIRAKEFKYLCDTGVSPEAVKTELKKTFSERDAARLANTFRIVQEIRNSYCNTDTTAREINKEFDLLKMYFTEKEFLDEIGSIQRRINAELREDERLDEKHVEEVKGFCEKFTEMWIARFLR